MPEDFNWIAFVTALGGASAIGLFFREIFNIFTLLRKGVSAKESKRRGDIVAQRDHAIQRAERAELRAEEAENRVDAERENRRIVWAHAARLERLLLLAGIEPGTFPDIDETTQETNR